MSKFLAFVLALSCIAPAYSQMFTLRHTFDDPIISPQNGFGRRSPSINGDQLLISDPYHQRFAAPISCTNPCDGVAYLIDINSGNLLRTFTDPNPTHRLGDRFGDSVDMDSERILIGESLGTPTDQVYLFDANTHALLNVIEPPIPASQLHQGVLGAWIQGDRIWMNVDRITGATGRVGEVHLLDAVTGNLIRTFDDPTPGNIGDQDTTFGRRVAFDETRVLISNYRDNTLGDGVGQAHLFDIASGNLLHTFNDPNPTADDRFGTAVAMDGNHVLVAANGDNTLGPSVGQAHLFDATTGQLLQTFDDPTPDDDDAFANAVAIDGDLVLINAYLDDTLGEDVGQVYLFDLSGNLLQTFNDPTPLAGQRFGRGLDFDRNRIVIGEQEDDEMTGAQVHLFTAAASPDFNEDGLLDCLDIDSLVAEIAGGTGSYSFDVTGDGVVDNADLDEWLVQAGAANLPSGNPFLIGDADLDGVVDGLDYIQWNNHKFTATAAWCSGDFNADGVVDGLDFVLWNDNKFTSSDSVSAVPEPRTGFFVIASTIILAVSRRRNLI